MESLKFTLIADGSSDKALINIIKWILNDLYPKLPIEGIFADFRKVPNPSPKEDIVEQIKFAEKLYPFDILFFHRDAESDKKNILDERKNEILETIEKEYSTKIICVIPIVMMETWLLIDEIAIKKAAGNRNYREKINLPAINNLEKLKEPKELMHNLLREISGLKKRNLKSFNVNAAVHLVSENINDFSPLRKLNSFVSFENDLKKVMNDLYKL